MGASPGPGGASRTCPLAHSRGRAGRRLGHVGSLPTFQGVYCGKGLPRASRRAVKQYLRVPRGGEEDAGGGWREQTMGGEPAEEEGQSRGWREEL